MAEYIDHGTVVVAPGDAVDVTIPHQTATTESIYLITANLHETPYDNSIYCLGVFNNADLVDSSIKILKSKHKGTLDVHELKMNELKEIYLGGYCE